jgi:hypothetical protein
MRFFLDYKTKDKSLYDYQGDEFMSSKDAFDFAQATADSLKNTLAADWTGWSVEVRDADGKKYFSFLVQTGRAIAAWTNSPPAAQLGHSTPGDLQNP